MTVVDFYLKTECGILRDTTEVAVTAASADMKSEFNVSLPDFEDGLTDISDYLFDWIRRMIEPAAKNAEDADYITAEELKTFQKVLGVIEW